MTWLTTPSTQILLGILLLVCLAGFYILIYIHRKKKLPARVSVEKLIEEGDFDTALTQYGQKIRTNPQLTQKVGTAFAKADRTDNEAVTFYEKIYKEGSPDNSVIQQLARCYALKGKDDSQAIEVYQKAIQLGVIDPVVLQITSDALIKQKEWEKATSILTTLVARGNASPETYVNLAQCFLKMQRHDNTALDIYQAALAAAPQDTTLILALSSFYSEQGRTDSNACFIYEQALKEKPDLVIVRMALSKAYLRQRKLMQCIEHCQYLVKRGIMDNDVMRLLAGVYLETGQWEESSSIYDRLCMQSPEEPEFIIGLARAYAGMRREDKQAFETYKKALELNNELVPVWEEMFRFYLARQDIHALIESAEKLLQLSPDSWKMVVPELEKLALRYPAELRIPLLLGDAYSISRQADYAISSYDRVIEYCSDEAMLQRVLKGFSIVLEFQPNSRDARMRRAKLYLQFNQLMDAIHDFEWIHEKDGAVAEVNQTLMALYQSLIQSGADIPPLIHFNLGRLYEDKQLWQDAILEYQQSAKHSDFQGKSELGMARCFLHMKKLDIAAEALANLPLTEESKEVLYILAQAYRQSEKYDKAMEILDKIYAVDAKFRDVGVILRETKMRSMEAQMEKTSLQKTPAPTAKTRFRIIEEIARGGMGIVCCAMDTVLNEMVALKMLPKNLAEDPQILERFLREVRSTRKLVHRNIVRIYDIVEEDGNQYISMEYVAGKNLRQLLREKGKIPEKEVAEIICQVCLALQAAHEQGVVHRDIKPANIMIDSTHTVKVMDFGIAKMKNEQKLTLTSDLLGTPVYMSPEQTQGLVVDHRSDIYSVGIMMYELLTGEVPFTKGNIGYQHIHVVPPVPMPASKPMQDIVMKCIEKRPTDRYQDANQLREALENSLKLTT